MSLLPAFIMPQPNDVSVTYLASILGQPFIDGVMGTTSASDATTPMTVFATMMNTFNHLLLGGGLIIFAILLVVGTMNTAAEGQFLGRQWHSVWTPMRLVVGILMVVPLNTGYCIGQYIILYAIMIGINFATTVWQSAIVDIFDDQATPPLPVYLTSQIQQAVGLELATVAVPQIISATGLGKTSGGQVATIPVNDEYVVGGSQSGNNNGVNTAPVPSSLAAAIVQQMTYFAGSGGSTSAMGLCNYLYSSLSSGTSGLCGQAVSSALTNAGAMGGQGGSYGGANIIVNVGSNAPATAAPPAYAMGMPFRSVWSNPDGVITVYGEYVYNPQALVPVPSTSPAGSGSGGGSSGGQSGSGSNLLGPGGTQRELGPGGVEPGAVVAYDQIQNIIANAAVGPIQQFFISGGPNNSAAWTTLLGTCQNGGVTPNTFQSVSAPCDLSPAVQGILNYAQYVAQQNALAYAEAGSAQGSNQGSPTPSGAQPVAPTGQGAALTNNMYICKDAEGQPAVCYNLNDYWVPDINSTSYIDLQLNNSWWMAGSSYLVLDNVLAQNLAWMADAVQQQIALLNNASNTNPSPASANYTCGSNMSNSTFDTNPSDLTNFITPELCINYNIQITEANPNLVGTQSSSASTQVYSQPNNPSSAGWTQGTSGICEVYPFFPGTYSGSGVPSGPSIQPYGASNQVNFYSCSNDQLRTTDPVNMLGKYTQEGSGAAISNWSSYIEPYDPNGSSSYKVDISNNPGFYEQLSALPGNLQMPFALLLQLAQNNSSSSTNYYQTLFPYLSVLLNILQYEGLLSGGNSVTSVLPVNQALNNIFTQLVGGGSGVGSAATASAAATGLNTVMQQVYNLGVSNGAEGAIANQFSLIQQAQAVGISMIMACISSMEVVYNNYTSALQGMVNYVSNVAASAGSTASIMTYASIALGPFGSLMNAVANQGVQQAQLAIMTTTVTTLSNIAVQLMWLPLLMFVLTSLFTAGVQFTIFVPLMPYILFWAGQIAWLLGVIEAIIAAPLVMLGLAHPGGHEIVGHTVPAVRLLLGVMFRPVLMVVGMIVGILLTYIVITFSAQGFHVVAAGILNAVPSGDQTVQGTLSCLMLFIYAAFLVMAFQKCFSAIYIIPERVVEWVGGMAQKAGEQELSQVGQTVQQTASGAAQAGSEALNKGLQAQQSKAQSMSDLAGKRMQTQVDIAKGYQQGASQTEQEVLQVAKLMM